MKRNFCLAFLLVLGTVGANFAQSAYPVTVVLESGGHNNEVPDFQKFKQGLEAGIKNLLVKDSVHVLKFNRDSTASRLANCNLLTCLYKISYEPGRMLNARVECTLSFIDCRKKEFFTVSDHAMIGAVASMNSYLKLFEKLIKPDLVKKVAAQH